MENLETSSDDSQPINPPSSRGSSVSTWMQDQYDEMIRYASVVPHNPEGVSADVGQEVLEKYTCNVSATSKVNPRLYLNEPAEISTPVDRTRPPSDPVRKPRDILPDMSDFHSDIIDDPSACLRPHIDTPEPQSTSDFSDHYDVLYSANIDPDVGKMEALLDRWSHDLKRNVLAEFSQSKVRVIELGKYQIQKNREKLESERTGIQESVESMKEMLHTYETTTERQERIITNLTLALQKQRDRQEMLRKFSDWRVRHNDSKRESFCMSLARKHHERRMMTRLFHAWHSVLETKWQSRVERACQTRAGEVCVTLTNDYEAKVASLNEALEVSQVQIERLKGERERYEDMMKKAFMRGVCALNLEAMSMFHGEDENDTPGSDSVTASGDPVQKECPPSPTMAALCTVTKHRGADTGQREVVVSTDANLKTSGKIGRKPRVFSAKISAKVDTGRTLQHAGMEKYQSVNQPMGSVIVERHQVSSKTSGPATSCVQTVLSSINKANKPGQIQRKNHSHAPLIPAQNIQPIKIID